MQTVCPVVTSGRSARTRRVGVRWHLLRHDGEIVGGECVLSQGDAGNQGREGHGLGEGAFSWLPVQTWGLHLHDVRHLHAQFNGVGLLGSDAITSRRMDHQGDAAQAMELADLETQQEPTISTRRVAVLLHDGGDAGAAGRIHPDMDGHCVGLGEHPEADRRENDRLATARSLYWWMLQTDEGYRGR